MTDFIKWESGEAYWPRGRISFSRDEIVHGADLALAMRRAAEKMMVSMVDLRRSEFGNRASKVLDENFWEVLK